jgi:hypothetical protein
MKGQNEQAIQQMQNDIKVLVSEISAKAQDSAQRAQMYETFWKENHGAAHDYALQKDQQSHVAEQQQLAQQAAQQQQGAQIGADQQSQQSDQAHQAQQAQVAQQAQPQGK